MSFTLPSLPYAYNALEPHFDARTMEIHHTKHHQAYVDNLNKAIADTEHASKSIEELMSQVSTLSPAVRNNGGGHYNHSLFWQILSPNGKKSPEGALATAIENELGGMEKLKADFAAAGMTRFGSGWAWVCVDTNKKLCVCSTPNQDNPLMDVADKKGTPILGMDVWEHAYYLHYQNRRGDYINAFWELINWQEVEARYQKAMN
ncbi:MAG: superoxide dismutase [Chitinophagaceae bacterium]|mgnify:CR=1 FL=1|nr:MAG: manganese/iron superoxide dismutase [Bacteroidetes bacterium OLB11]MCC6447558.1 superoxide dismutase [Chitinophagaceae bacterium]HMN32060.1 superoxide dismutase [Chitinophagaceae bacterium]